MLTEKEMWKEGREQNEKWSTYLIWLQRPQTCGRRRKAQPKWSKTRKRVAYDTTIAYNNDKNGLVNSSRLEKENGGEEEKEVLYSKSNSWLRDEELERRRCQSDMTMTSGQSIFTSPTVGRTDGQTDSELDTVKAGAWLLLSLL